MKKEISVLFLSMFSVLTLLQAQTKISGKIIDQKKEGIPGASIYIKGSYDGTSSDVNGNFSLTVTDTGAAALVISMMSYETVEQKLNLAGKDVILTIALKESLNQLKAVTISAGSIEASDEKKITVLKPLDIVTTANSAGDIYGALKTLPGAQQVGESEGLFVRGGSGNETRTIIDGMYVGHPFYSGVPNIAQRGRFSPFLFKGTIFSTGGYSAQYGQAMSSALVLETKDLPDRTFSDVTLSAVGVFADHNHLWKEKNASAGFDVSYINLKPYYSLVKQKADWESMPVIGGGSVNFRKKTSASGILKFYGYANISNLTLLTKNLDSANFKDRFELSNTDVYSNLTYKERISDKWLFNAGTSYSYNIDHIKLNTNKIIQNDDLIQGKAVFSRSVHQLSMIRVGGEINHSDYYKSYNQYNANLKENFTAVFVENDCYLTQNFVARLGGRIENSDLLQKVNIAPRLSLAHKIATYSQVSFAYGDFYQNPATNYLYTTTKLGYEKATHYIFNFQRVTDLRTIRAEIYYKQYSDLIKTSFSEISNSGNGYAQGFDLFWRDKETIRNVDYWVSYSYLDTKRNYLNFSQSATPYFAATHTFSLVMKKFFSSINTYAGITYSYASGRPFYNPANPVFPSGQTKDFHDLGINLNYIRKTEKAFFVFILSCGNILGIDNVYGYRYSNDGTKMEALMAPAKRTIFFGVFMSFGQDRTKEVINNNN